MIPIMADSGGRWAAEFVAILCRENLLLTVHAGPLAGRRHDDKIGYSEFWLADRSIAALIAGLMISQSLLCVQHTADLRRSIASLDEKINLDPDGIGADEILDQRSRLTMLGTVVHDQLPALKALSAADKPFFKRADAQEYLNCAQVNLEAAHGALERLDSKISDLRDMLQMHAQDKTNRRLAMLTVLSAIFMPLTLMAGIWGMNFEHMPELRSAIGYPLALGSMALIGSAMFLFFRKGGWFD